ncbi:MAG: glycosyltransferase, partial [Chloroflexi bacterium]|nr:glycosyltransferase [Chloroflexota bacterium]
LSESELITIYNGAQVFAFPSLYEGGGLPPLEALACGTPVVTSNHGAVREVVGDAAITVDPLSVPAIAEGLRRCLSDESLRAELRARGLERAQQFSWHRTAQLTLAAYQLACSN